MLGQLLSQLLDKDHRPTFDYLMLKAAITLGFFGYLESASSQCPPPHGFNPDHHLTSRDITVCKDSIVLFIKKFKTNQRGDGCQIHIGHPQQVLSTSCNAEVPGPPDTICSEITIPLLVRSSIDSQGLEVHPA